MRVLFLESHPMWVHGLPSGFQDAGHAVMVSGPLTRNLPQLISAFDPELIVTMGWGPENAGKQKQLWIRDQVRSAGVPHVYWATEDPTSTETFTLPYLRTVQPDFVFTICRARVDEYRAMGILSAHLDFGYHPSVHAPVAADAGYRCAIACVANGYAQRLRIYPDHFRHKSLQTLIVPLLQANIRIDFYGRHWEAMSPVLGVEIPREWLHGYLPYTEANQVYSAADLVIGLQNHPQQLSQRTYEILGSGGLLLTDDTPEVRRLFTPGRDLLVSSEPAQTLQLVRQGLQQPDERERIRTQGRLAVADHSYRHRAESVLQVLQDEGIFAGKRSRYDHVLIQPGPQIRGDYEVHTVCNGDTLWGIANRYRVPIALIKALNGLTADLIYPGEVLKLRRVPAAEPRGPSVLITAGDVSSRQIALTYDAGAAAGAAGATLDVLRKHGVRSTFFLTGRWVEEFPDLARRIATEGHEIGNHTYGHPDLTQLSRAASLDEIMGGEAAIRQITGQETRPLFRPPYGAWNQAVLAAAGEAGFGCSIYWSLDTLDWQHPPAQVIVRRILEKANGGGIVLMHVGGRETAAASDRVIPELQARGFALVTVGELLASHPT